MQKISTGTIIATVATGLFLTLLTSGLLMSYQTIPSQGAVAAVNVGVYSDSECTQNCTFINWGTIMPGSQINRTVYVKNIGGLPMTITMATESWLPTNASSLINLNWNRQDTTLNVNQSIGATLTLAAAASAAGNLTDFSFNIIITGTE
jgi:hypothetical protein